MPHTELSHQQTMICEPRKLDPAFETLGKHDPRRAIVQRNANCSPLLRLPGELRRQIYREVLGDRFIHLKYLPHKIVPIWLRHGNRIWNDFQFPTKSPRASDDGYCWIQYVCNKGGPKSAGELEYCGMQEHTGRFVQYMADAYPGASTWPPRIEALKPRRDEVYDREMHLPLLRVCRQMYNEASQVLWTMNTFSFNSAITCQRFLDGRRISQTAALRSLHLVVDIDISSTQWYEALCNSWIPSMKGLVDLGLFVKDVLEVEDYKKAKSRGGEYVLDTYFGIWVPLSQLPQLQRVDVCMAPDFWLHKAKPWCQRDKDELAELLKERLLARNQVP